MKVLMKLFLILFSLSAFAHNGCDSINENKSQLLTPIELTVNGHSTYQTVYICGGKYAYAYHSYQNCKGLNNCQSKVYYTSENDAINQYGREPCCLCWNNVAERCKYDGATSAGGRSGNNGDAEALVIVGAVVGVAIITSGVILVSNELYLGGIYSTRYKENGIAVHFRSNIKEKFGLEYGVRYFSNSSTAGAYFNFTRNIEHNKVHQNLIPYLGITSSYGTVPYEGYYQNDQFIGLGGIIGCGLSLHERLKLDLRYEITNNSSNFILGLQVLYQKKNYFTRRKEKKMKK